MAIGTNKKIRVVVVDEQELVRMGIKAGLATKNRIVIVAEGTTETDAIRLVNEYCPDVILLGLNGFTGQSPLSGYLTTCEMIKRVNKTANTHFLVLSRHDNRGLVQCMLRAGASGFLQKYEAMNSCEELAQAIIKIAQKGKLPLSSILYEKLHPYGLDVENIPQLTERKIEIMQAMADNPRLTLTQIAGLLGIAESTLRNNLSAISRSLDTPNANGAMIECLRLGLIQIGQ